MEAQSYEDEERKRLPNQQALESNSQTPTGDSDIGSNTTDGENPIQSLSNLSEFLKSEVPDEPSAQLISETAHELIDKLNSKRKIDTLLIEQFRQAMESQTAKIIEELEQHMYSRYEMINVEVDEKLQKLFSCVNRIGATEGELETFRESLRMLYQEMHNV